MWSSEVQTILHENICTGHMDIHRKLARLKIKFYCVGFKVQQKGRFTIVLSYNGWHRKQQITEN